VKTQYTSDNSSGHSKLALSRNEAAQMLGISAISLDRLVKRGLVHPSRAMRRPLFPIWELDRFLRDTAKEVKI